MNQPMVLSSDHHHGTTRPHPSNHYDHSRSAKRRCRNQRESKQAGIRDCYEEAMSSTPKTRHSWLFETALVIRKDKPRHNYNYQYNSTLLIPPTELETLQQQLQHAKHQFRPLSEQCAALSHKTPAEEFQQARRACNPYESLGETRAGGLNHGLFLNRSAIKLANMDAMLHFSLTTTTTTDNTFCFVDLCGAPGGFSEYLLRRVSHNITQNKSSVSCRGYGMSLGNGDGGTPWKLTPGPMLMGRGERPSVHYQICLGDDGTGDILKWNNVQCLQRKIAVAQAALRPQVALVVADGGVDAQRNVDHPEAQTEELVVCQVAAALSVLQPGGRFLIKLLACQSTPVLQRVLQVLYDHFQTLQVLKPISSRPASAERYLVCSGYRPVEFELLGPAWIQQILRTVEPPAIAPELLAFLTMVDRDILQLNLRACRAIVSHMEEKRQRLATPAPTAMTASIMGNSKEDGDDTMEEDDAWIAQGYHNYHSDAIGKGRRKKKINVNNYKTAWKLF